MKSTSKDKCEHLYCKETKEFGKLKHTCVKCGAFRYTVNGKRFKWIEKVETIDLGSIG